MDSLLALLGIRPKLVSPLPEGQISPHVKTLEDYGWQKGSDNVYRQPTANSSPIPMPMPTMSPDLNNNPYYNLINNAALQNSIPSEILYRLLRKESMNFNPDVISGKLNSPVGAQGIAQFMPETAKGMGFNPLNPNEAIPQAAKYLKAKKERHGTWENALAAYNAGSGAVEKYGGIPPYQETINYVKSILQNLNLR